MPSTTAWERHLRRQKVIQLRYGRGLTVSEISEELDWSEATINRDLDRIRRMTAEMGEPEFIREQMFVSLTHLLDHEFDDLHRATLQGDERAKHRAKRSFRDTLRLLMSLDTEISAHAPDGAELIKELPAEARDAIAEVADEKIAEEIRS